MPPRFIKNELFLKKLSRFGQVVSPIKMVSLGCKSPLLKHVVCRRRQVFMIPKDSSAELNLSFNFKGDGFNYIVFATSETMKCVLIQCVLTSLRMRTCLKKS